MKHRLFLAALVLVATSFAAPTFAEPRKSDERVVFRTELGDLVFAMYPDVAPNTVAEFERLVRAHVYDGTRFSRIEPSFVVQLATAQDRLTPLTAEQTSLIHPLPAEFTNIRHRRGVLSMAHEDNRPDSGETSFSVLLVDAPHLDGKYTIFGELDQGEDVLQAIASVARDPENHPLQRVGVNRAFVLGPNQLFGFQPRPPGGLARKDAPPKASPTQGETPKWVLIFMSAMGALGIATYALAGRVSATVTGSLGLLIALVGFFSCFAVWAPAMSYQSGWGAVALFVGAIATFKLMGRFEHPR